MYKITALFKKIVLAALVAGFALTAIPTGGASAAGLKEMTGLPGDTTRLEKVWAREQALYLREGSRLVEAANFIARVQHLVDKASQKGWDTASVQAALDALSAVLPAVQAAHAPGAALITSHAGFDAAGQVTDRSAALATARSLAQVLKDTRTALAGTAQALRAALQALRNGHPRPGPVPAG